MTKDEALKLALEALKMIDEAMPFPVAKLAQSAIKEALMSVPDGAHPTSGDYALGYAEGFNDACKKPEQEPVAWSYWQSCLNDDGTQTAPWVHRLSKLKPSESIINKDVVPLYTTPLQRKPLTDEEIENAANSNLCIYSFARAIEAAHGIKENT